MDSAVNHRGSFSIKIIFSIAVSRTLPFGHPLISILRYATKTAMVILTSQIDGDLWTRAGVKSSYKCIVIIHGGCETGCK